MTNTTVEGKLCNPRRCQEEQKMYLRHWNRDQISIRLADFQLTQKNYYEWSHELKYEPNPFDTSLKKKKRSATVFLPADPSIKGDCLWVIEPDDQHDEKQWCELRFDIICDAFFNQWEETEHDSSMAFNSCVHRGYVRKTFDLDHCSYSQRVYDWVSVIGPQWNSDAIALLKGVNIGFCHSEGIDGSLYVGNFYTSDVKKICQYCADMFGIPKFEIAKLFVKVSLETLLEKMEKTSTLSAKRYMLHKIGCLHAENDDYIKAREFFQKAADVPLRSIDDFWRSQCVKLDEYVKQHGTSRLFSDL